MRSQYYWANFGGINDEYYIMIGRKLTTISFEDETSFFMDFDKLKMIDEDVKLKLRNAQIETSPKLIMRLLYE
ncbi:MAG: hypothetical protein LBK60_03305 [Verrucomicrobiales bacterium]|jgi:hypothetical protein|nr:hypothetical protein [Verrucomicrobiales bacterium]